MPHLTRRLKCGPHLGRMVCVVVVDRRALEHAEKLQPPVRAGESLEGARYVGEAHAQLERHRGGSGRVPHVVAAGLPEGDPAPLVPAVMNRGWGAPTTPIVGRLAGAGGD